jgi:hypothetical protein
VVAGPGGVKELREDREALAPPLLRPRRRGFERECGQRPDGILKVMIFAPGYPRPSATTRKRVTDVIKRSRVRKYFFAMVTESILIRGILTAIQWVQPAPPGHEYTAHATFEDAARWLEERRGAPLPFLDRLLAEARGEPATAGVP